MIKSADEYESIAKRLKELKAQSDARVGVAPVAPVDPKPSPTAPYVDTESYTGTGDYDPA
jgi:hypothetical protein